MKNLEVKDKIIITVFNKIDKLEEKPIMKDFNADYTVETAIKNGIGLDELNEIIEKALKSMRIHIEKLIPLHRCWKAGTY